MFRFHSLANVFHLAAHWKTRGVLITASSKKTIKKKEKGKAPLGLWGRIKRHFRIRRLSAMWWPFAVTHEKYKRFDSAS